MTGTDAVISLFENQLKQNCEIHSLTVYRGGKKIFSGAPCPYSTHDKNQVYSMSKSFCSTAVGIAQDKGLLSLNEKIIDIFPEKCPEKISDNLAQMTLLHVLSMNTGHEECVMNKMITSDDPVAAFLSSEVKYVPGTHFTYNTGATFLASACINRRTGMSAYEFLEKNLFEDLDIRGAQWNSRFGISEGGVGLHISSEDAAKLGLLYLYGGVYGGKRLLSEDYCSLAVSKISDNSLNGNPDWCAGYGLQFWKNSREGFRADGAFGQLCMVFPEKELVVAMIAETGDMQKEIDCVYDFADNICGGGNTETTDSDTLSDYLKKYYIAGQFSEKTPSFAGKTYIFEENPCGFSKLTSEKTENGITIYISGSYDACLTSRIEIKSGKWTKGILHGNYVKPDLDGFTASHNCDLYYSACGFPEDENSGEFTVMLRALNCPHKVTYTFKTEGEKLKITRKGGYNSGHYAEFTAREA